MRIAILGNGGVEGYDGGLLSQQGQEVIFIVRGSLLQAIRHKSSVVRQPNPLFDLA